MFKELSNIFSIHTKNTLSIMASTSTQYDESTMATVQIDMNVLATFASLSESDNPDYETITTARPSVSFIGRLSRLLSSAFGTSNAVIYTSNDAYNKA